MTEVNSQQNIKELFPTMETTTEEVSNETTLFAEPIFHIGNFTVTNSLLNSWLVVVFLIALAVIIKKKLAKIPKGIQNVMEMLVEAILNLCDSVTHSRKKSQQVFPIIITLFVFILLNNWSGILPGVGSIGFIERGHGEAIFVPLFRGGTADFNTTLALAVMAVIGSNLFGVITIGFYKFFNKFINIKGLLEIPKKILKDPSIIIVNPIKFFVGIIEIIGEIAKVASLSFRLFGNVFAGEVLLSSMAVIFAYAVPIPFLFLEIFVGLVQALIFSLLTLVYFSIASTAEEH